MNIFKKIGTLFKVKSFVQKGIKEATKMNGSKPGWQTTEFWLNLAAQAGVLWGAVSQFIPPKYAAIISTAGVAVYTIARTIAKAIQDIKASKTEPVTATKEILK